MFGCVCSDTRKIHWALMLQPQAQNYYSLSMLLRILFIFSGFLYFFYILLQYDVSLYCGTPRRCYGYPKDSWSSLFLNSLISPLHPHQHHHPHHLAQGNSRCWLLDARGDVQIRNNKTGSQNNSVNY